jgi:hypothetical protein
MRRRATEPATDLSERDRATVAVALDNSGRHHFVTSDGAAFTRIAHFPASLAEAKRLASVASGPALSRQQIAAAHSSQIVLVPMAAGLLGG